MYIVMGLRYDETMIGKIKSDVAEKELLAVKSAINNRGPHRARNGGEQGGGGNVRIGTRGSVMEESRNRIWIGWMKPLGSAMN